MQGLAIKLFTGLGIQVIENPAFITTWTCRTITIPGVYIPSPNGKIMLVNQRFDLETEDFLSWRNISVLRTNLHNWRAESQTRRLDY